MNQKIINYLPLVIIGILFVDFLFISIPKILLPNFNDIVIDPILSVLVILASVFFLYGLNRYRKNRQFVHTNFLEFFIFLGGSIIYLGLTILYSALLISNLLRINVFSGLYVVLFGIILIFPKQTSIILSKFKQLRERSKKEDFTLISLILFAYLVFQAIVSIIVAVFFAPIFIVAGILVLYRSKWSGCAVGVVAIIDIWVNYITMLGISGRSTNDLIVPSIIIATTILFFGIIEFNYRVQKKTSEID